MINNIIIPIFFRRVLPGREKYKLYSPTALSYVDSTQPLTSFTTSNENGIVFNNTCAETAGIRQTTVPESGHEPSNSVPHLRHPIMNSTMFPLHTFPRTIHGSQPTKQKPKPLPHINKILSLDHGNRQNVLDPNSGHSSDHKQVSGSSNQYKYKRPSNRYSDLQYAGTAYQQALKEGQCAANLFKLVMLGPHGAGKTSTVHSLLGKEFQPHQPSTVGTDISYVSTTDTVNCMYACDWELNEFQRYMEELSTKCAHELKVKMMKTIEILKHAQRFPKHTVYDSAGMKVLQNEAAPKGKTRIIIYDIGGQEIYYDIQFLFLASHDLIFLTFNASIGLDEPLITQQCYEDCQKKYKIGKQQTNFQAIEATLHAVHSYCGEKCKNSVSPRIPTVIMVATHAFGLTENEKKKIANTLLERLADTPLSDHFPNKDIIDFIYFIDNHERDTEAFKTLKFVTILAAEFALTEIQPISFMKFEEEILIMSKNVSMIGKEAALQIATKAGLENSHKTLEELLQYYTRKGVLLHYSQAPTLSCVVFISPQMVSNLVSFVIKTHNFAKFGHTAELRKKFIRFDKFGLLEEALLDDMLERLNNSNYTKELVLGFLETFYLAVEIDKETKFQNEEDSYPVPDSGRVFFVPSVLMYNKSKDYVKPEHHIDNVVLFHFPDKFLPSIIFNYTLILVIRWCKDKGHSIRW